MANYPPTEANILAVASHLRRLFEELAPTLQRGGWLAEFPKASCGHSSELVARYMREKLGWNALYLGNGERDADDKTHAWVEIGPYTVDLTADQFADCQEPVIVARVSDWHAQWQTDKPRPPCITTKEWPAYPYDAWNFLVSRPLPLLEEW